MSRLPHEPDSRNLAVGICVTGIYAINTGAQVGMWPASQAPYCTFSSCPYPTSSVGRNCREHSVLLTHVDTQIILDGRFSLELLDWASPSFSSCATWMDAIFGQSIYHTLLGRFPICSHNMFF